MVLERDFQSWLIKQLELMFPGAWITKLDTSYRQGSPDLLILFRNRWAVLECKREMPTSEADYEPNQVFYLIQLNQMSFAACIYPENAEEVLNALQHALAPRRVSRVSQR